MNTRRFTHLGFGFDVDPLVLQALALTHLVGRDLRAAEGLLGRIFVEMLRTAQARFGEELFRAGASLRFRLQPTHALKTRMSEVLDGSQVRTYLVTRNPRVERLIRRSLPKAADPLQVVSSREALLSLLPGVLVILDALETAPKHLAPFHAGLDAQVQRTLVDAGVHRWLEPHERDATLPVKTPLTAPQNPLVQGLAEAFDTARFCRVFERFRASRLRWRTHWDLAFLPAQGLVQATFSVDGEERVLRAQDLKRDIPWAEIPSLGFRDVLGLSAAKAQLQAYLDWLKDPRGESGVRACVLSGPPGTGKTHACLATAGEANVPCIVMGGAEFLSQWYGETERIIRETFASLSQYDSAVLVIDEFEGIAWSRAQSNEWQANHQASIVGELLRSVDRLRMGPGRVLLLATTNQYERLDSALVRSLRLDDRIHLGLPDAAERRAMLADLLAPECAGTDREEAVGLTTGLSCADLVRLVASARKAAMAAGTPFDLVALRGTVFEARRGPAAGSALQDPILRRQVSVHEAGHALVAFLLLGGKVLEHVSIAPSAGGTLGAAYLRLPEDLELVGRAAIRHRIAILLAGRAAETLLFPEEGPSCGIALDLESATALATAAISRWGMDEDFPLLSLEGLPPDLRSRVGDRLLARVQIWLEAAKEHADGLLRYHRADLERLAEALQREETLHRPELLRLLEGSA